MLCNITICAVVLMMDRAGQPAKLHFILPFVWDSSRKNVAPVFGMKRVSEVPFKMISGIKGTTGDMPELLIRGWIGV